MPKTCKDPREIVVIGANQRDRHPPPKYKELPKHEHTMLIVAAPGSGKTNFICNLLLNHYKGYFHNVYVASPTVETDDKWEEVKKTKGVLSENPHKSKVVQMMEGGGAPMIQKMKTAQPLEKVMPAQLFPHLNREMKCTLYGNIVKKDKTKEFDGKIPEENFVETLEDLLPLLKKQKDKITQLKKLVGVEKAMSYSDRILVIADDQAGLFNQSNGKNPVVNFYFKHRHHNCSVWTVTQAYKAIPKKIRTATDDLVLFEIGNQKELQDVYQDWEMGLTQDEWMSLYNYAVKEPFSFLFINRKIPDKSKRIWIRFIKPLWPSTRANNSDHDTSDSE